MSEELSSRPPQLWNHHLQVLSNSYSVITKSPLCSPSRASFLIPTSPKHNLFLCGLWNSTRREQQLCQANPSFMLAPLAITQKARDRLETSSDGRRRHGRLNLQQSPACRNLPVTCRPHKPLASPPSCAVNELRRHFKTEHFAAIYGPSQGLQQLSDFLVGLPEEKLQITAALPTLLQLEHLKKIKRKISQC